MRSGFIVPLALGAVEECMVHDLAVGGAIGVGVVGDRAGDGALLEVADVFPALGGCPLWCRRAS